MGARATLGNVRCRVQPCRCDSRHCSTTEASLSWASFAAGAPGHTSPCFPSWTALASQKPPSPRSLQAGREGSSHVRDATSISGPPRPQNPCSTMGRTSLAPSLSLLQGKCIPKYLASPRASVLHSPAYSSVFTPLSREKGRTKSRRTTGPP